MILWWEKKRLIYNVIAIAAILFSLYSFWDYPMRGIIGEGQIIINSVLILIFVNVLYTAGWGLEVGSHYFFETKGMNPMLRWLLFIIGTTITVFALNFYFALEFDVLFAKI